MNPERAADALDDMTDAELLVFAWERGLTVRRNQVMYHVANRTSRDTVLDGCCFLHWSTTMC